MRVSARMRQLLTLRPEWGRRCDGQARRAPARQPAERRARRRQHLLRVHRADRDDCERFRHVVTPVESCKRFARESPHQLGRADHAAAVGMALEELRVELEPEPATRAVFAETHLVEDDVFLLLEHVGVERRIHRDVGEHLEPRDHAARGKRHVIEGVVPRRARVHPAADSLHVALDETARARGAAGRGTVRTAPQPHTARTTSATLRRAPRTISPKSLS